MNSKEEIEKYIDNLEQASLLCTHGSTKDYRDLWTIAPTITRTKETCPDCINRTAEIKAMQRLL